ncbi:MAG: hypothetical protein AAF228_01595 [Pseudomonadota bacterium]
MKKFLSALITQNEIVWVYFLCLVLLGYALGPASLSANQFPVAVVPTKPNIVKVQEVGTFSVKDVKGFSGNPAPVIIKLPNDLKQSDMNKIWLRVIGLPKNLRFSVGSLISDIWFIPVHKISDLSLISPPGYSGNFSLSFFLMKRDTGVVIILSKKNVGVDLQTAVSSLPSELANDATTSGNNSANVSGEIKLDETLPKLTSQEETVLLKRASELVALGTYAPARLIYEELAKRGSSKGAFELAKLYDPIFIRDAPASGMKPDIEKARKWYSQSSKLGNQDALLRLYQLQNW